MSDTSLNQDPPADDLDREIFIEFLDESMDSLEDLDELIVQLESSPEDLALINQVFRPIHSLKGNAAFFGLLKVRKLAHSGENLLDMLRKGKLRANKQTTELLLAALDELKGMFSRVRAEEPEVEDEDRLAALIVDIDAVVARKGVSALPAWEELVERLDKIRRRLGSTDQALVSELELIITSLRTAFLKEGKEPSAGAKTPSMVADIRAIVGRGGDPPVTEAESARVGTLLEQLRDQVEGDKAVECVDKALRAYKAFMGTVGFDDMLCELLCEGLDELEELAAWKTALASGQAAVGRTETRMEETEPSKGKLEVSKTMRISEDYIDAFLAYVGELIVMGEMFRHLQTRLAETNEQHGIVRDFRRVNETFSALSANLRNSIMSIRTVPVRQLLKKAPRIIRDIAKEKGKEIEVALVGEEVGVDKSIIDLLDAPLTHMVRNSADHGIELPETREAMGKPRAGEVRVSVEETDTFIVLTVQDDGAGLNYDALQKKAETLGLVKAGESLSEAQVVDLLFMPGVSTAAVVTEVSGRGVGMDVVKREIENAGGDIQVASEPGKGTTFTLRVTKSVTTQIMNGFVVEVGGYAYIMPMDKIFDAAELDETKVTEVVGKGRCINRHAHVLPLLSMRKLLGVSPDVPRKLPEIVVTLRAQQNLVAFTVDDVLGVHQVVLKNIEGMETVADIFDGGALMGDGSIAMVVNVDQLCADR
ncbi:MAG: chemotaxis protein CheA [Spartobacteria bacterium]|nr:chemotaxis protein CheA [Spartobacteria bacterium]